MQTINLNQNSFRLFPTIYMVQNDTGRELKMILDDVTLAGTETGAVAIKRSDGSYYTISATIDTTNNAFDADMTQALTQPSRTECQLKVTASDDTVISTYTFIIMVQPSTDGISEEQLGYSVQEVVQAANDIMSGGMPLDLRMALLQIASKVAYIDDQGQQYYQDLYDALMPSVELVSISAVYTQSGTVYDTDTLDSLKSDLVVTASYSDGTTETVPSSAYTLSGTLEEGTSTITVSYDGKTDEFDVAVTHNDILYKLTSAFTSNGSNSIDTGVAWEKNKQYALVITFSVSSFANTAAFVYGDSYGESSGYTALSTQYASSSNYIWGSGLAYASGKGVASANQTVKFVFNFDVGADTYTRNWYFKNVTSGTSKSGTQSNPTTNIKGYNIFLGKQETSGGVVGFAGTITDFKIYDRLLSYDEIVDYMGGEQLVVPWMDSTYDYAIGNYASDNTNGLYPTNGTGTSARCTFCYDMGLHKYRARESLSEVSFTTCSEVDYYPIPIPSGATTLNITFPSAYEIVVNIIHYDDAVGCYVRDANLTPWSSALASHTVDISAYNDGTKYLALNIKAKLSNANGCSVSFS